MFFIHDRRCTNAVAARFRAVIVMHALLAVSIVIAGSPLALDAQPVSIPAGLVDRNDTVLTVQPSATDGAIVTSDLAHVVIYDRNAKPGNILLFLPGTGGRPPGPVRFLNRAVARGYRAIYLSYIDEPAVSQVCIGLALRSDPECGRHFRTKRAFGTDDTPLIGDTPHDSIANRFTKLLQYLVANDREGRWEQYLDGGSPLWSRVAAAGQSQGGGMAEFIGQRQAVARVIAFSGGWDLSAPGQIATWYGDKAATPLDRWYGTYNVAEPMATLLARTYTALGVPPDHTFALDLPVRDGRNAHGEGVSNPDYQDIWDQLLGDGLPSKR